MPVNLDNLTETNGQRVTLGTGIYDLGTGACGFFCRFFARSITSSANRNDIWHAQTTGDTGYYNFLTIVNTGTIWWYRGVTSGSLTNAKYSLSTATVATGVWNTVCINDGSTFTNAAEIEIYINGTVDGTTTDQNGLGTPSTVGSWRLGGWATNTTRMFNGLMSDVVMINRPYETAERQALEAGTWWEDIDTILPEEIIFAVRCNEDRSTTTVAGWVNETPTNFTLSEAAGTCSTTEAYPADVPNLALHCDLTDAGNTITAERIATLLNLAGTDATNLTQSGTSGPANIDTAGVGINVEHAAFGMTNLGAVTATETFVQRATGGGPTWNARNLTVVIFGASRIVNYEAFPDPLTIINFGNPIDTDDEPPVMRLSVERGGKLTAWDSSATPVERLSDCFMPCALPRMVACVCTASDTQFYLGGTLISTEGALAAATGTGVRIGARNHNTSSTDFFLGDIYRVLVYQGQLTATQLAALDALGQAWYGYTTPTRAIALDGSSTGYGWYATKNQTILKRLGPLVPDYFIANFANASEGIVNFTAGYASEGGAFATFCDTIGVGKSRRMFFFQALGNDYSYIVAGSPANMDTAAEIQAANIALCQTILADYGHLTVIPPIVSTGWGGGGDEVRESLAQDWLVAMSPYGRIMDRPSAITPADGTQASLDAVTADATYYGQGGALPDVPVNHLKDAGFALYANPTDGGLILDEINRAFATGGARTRAFRSRNWR